MLYQSFSVHADSTPVSMRSYLEQFKTELFESGLLSANDLTLLLSGLAEDQRPTDAEKLARLLVKRKLLTAYQVQNLYAGKRKSLILGNYLVLDKLGQGGMGLVLKARHRRMDRLVALKVMAPAAMKSPDAVKRFHREVQAAARLTHPNIVIAHDADEANGTHFLVMEYVEGLDLHQHVRQVGSLPVDQVLNYVLQAARGLEFAHQQGVVHRDIKPANLLLDQNGTIKILDMGLARLEGAIGGEAEGTGLTSTGTIMGTVDFMSPEQAMDTKHADARSDIYSLGCTLYHLIVGQAIYSGDTVMKRLMAHQSSPIPDLPIQLPVESGSKTDLSACLPRLNTIFRRMVAKDPKDRYQTVAEVISELELCFNEIPEGISTGQHSSESQSIDEPSDVPGFVVNSFSSSRSRSGKRSVGAHAKTVIVESKLLASDVPGSPETLIFSADRPTDTLVTQNLLQPGGRKISPRAALVAAGGGAFLMLLLGTWVIVRDKDGKEVANVPVPPGGSVIVQETPGGNSTTPQSAPTASVWQPTPEQQAFFDRVAKLTAEEQVKVVHKKLAEVNPGFADAQITHEVNDGKVVTFEYRSDAEEIDIWPVRALSDLKKLVGDAGSYTGSGHFRRRGVQDLSPLRGLFLTHIESRGTRIQELSPLQEMPLSNVILDLTEITSLEALRGMPIRILRVNGTKISDLSILKGMPLVHLTCGYTLISDLTPLKDLPLQYLDIQGTQVSDFSPIRGMPLFGLVCARTQISDLSFLTGSKLRELNCEATPVTDLSVLKEMPLVRLICDPEILVRNLSLLKGIETLQTINGKPAQEVLESLVSSSRPSWQPTLESLAFFRNRKAIVFMDRWEVAAAH